MCKGALAMKFRSGLILALLVLCQFAFAQEPTQSDDNSEATKLRAVLDRSTEPFEVFSAKNPGTAMTSKSVLRWINNERDTQSLGVVVLWIDHGQPAVAMATYNWAGNIHHEFDLLSRESVIAKRNGATIWQPKIGLKFQSVPNAPAVETTATARLRQMKSLAEQFSATMMGWKADKSDRAELRRLPRELFRYQPENPDVIDGAVFAYVMGNDPEALLLIEAVKGKSQAEWQYAFVRQTSGELQGRHLNTIVWTAPPEGFRNDPAALGFGIGSRLNLKNELAK
jgi:hypothetical protein